MPGRFSLGGVGAGRAVCQLDQRYDGDADSGSADFASDGGKHLPSIFPLTLRCDQNASVEDQSHAGGANGSRWLSMAASTSLGKSGSMGPVESSGSKSLDSEMVRRTGSAA